MTPPLKNLCSSFASKTAYAAIRALLFNMRPWCRRQNNVSGDTRFSYLNMHPRCLQQNNVNFGFATEPLKCHRLDDMARYCFIPCRLNILIMSTWRDILSCHVNLIASNYVDMARYVILRSRLMKSYMST